MKMNNLFALALVSLFLVNVVVAVNAEDIEGDFNPDYVPALQVLWNVTFELDDTTTRGSDSAFSTQLTDAVRLFRARAGDPLMASVSFGMLSENGRITEEESETGFPSRPDQEETFDGIWGQQDLMGTRANLVENSTSLSYGDTALDLYDPVTSFNASTTATYLMLKNAYSTSSANSNITVNYVTNAVVNSTMIYSSHDTDIHDVWFNLWKETEEASAQGQLIDNITAQNIAFKGLYIYTYGSDEAGLEDTRTYELYFNDESSVTTPLRHGIDNPFEGWTLAEPIVHGEKMFEDSRDGNSWFTDDATMYRQVLGLQSVPGRVEDTDNMNVAFGWESATTLEDDMKASGISALNNAFDELEDRNGLQPRWGVSNIRSYSAKRISNVAKLSAPLTSRINARAVTEASTTKSLTSLVGRTRTHSIRRMNIGFGMSARAISAGSSVASAKVRSLGGGAIALGIKGKDKATSMMGNAKDGICGAVSDQIRNGISMVVSGPKALFKGIIDKIGMAGLIVGLVLILAMVGLVVYFVWKSKFAKK